MDIKEIEIGLSKRQQEILKKNLFFYKSLECGKRIPSTKAQKHFVSVCKGKSRIETEHEYIYIKYRNNLRRRHAKILSKILDSPTKSFNDTKIQYKSRKPRKTVNIERDWKKSEKERISKTLLRRKNITNAMVVFSD